MSKERFETVVMDSFTKSEMTPQIDLKTFRGLQIVMPETLGLDELVKVPVCGAWVFTGDVFQRLGDMDQNFVFLVRSISTHEPYSGNFRMNMTFDKETPTAAGIGADRRGTDTPNIKPEKMRMGGYFNFNLARVWDIPAEPARYRLIVVVDDFQSNEVEFAVGEPKQ